MFKKELQEKLERMFGLKSTFDLPSESYEQEKLFIEISESIGNAGEGKVRFRVTGAVYMYVQTSKAPYGYFTRRISRASSEDLKGFFFFDETTPVNSHARLLNLIESRIAFTFLYKAELDPNQGELTSVEGL